MSENTSCTIGSQCIPCEGGVPALSETQKKTLIKQINKNWQLTDSNKKLTRKYTFKNFGKTMHFVNAVAYIADQQGHHPDITFSYNYCHVTFTTHAIDELTENDFICAQAVDRLS